MKAFVSLLHKTILIVAEVLVPITGDTARGKSLSRWKSLKCMTEPGERVI